MLGMQAKFCPFPVCRLLKIWRRMIATGKACFAEADSPQRLANLHKTVKEMGRFSTARMVVQLNHLGLSFHPQLSTGQRGWYSTDTVQGVLCNW
eukprot:scaffold1734_cov380-Prasinococcus_capsulatus_cf.AAC.3